MLSLFFRILSISSAAMLTCSAGAQCFPETLDLSEFTSGQGLILNGIDPSDAGDLGVPFRAIADIGDFNGDGFDDIVIGASRADEYLGEAYVVFGGTDVGENGTLELADLDGQNGFVIHGVVPEGSFGKGVGGDGDVNNDGYSDVVIGSWRADSGGIDRSGGAYCIFGGPTVGADGEFDITELDGQNGFAVEGFRESGLLGRSAAIIGDVNDDGFDDVGIGGGPAGANGEFAGEAFVVFGGTEVGISGVVQLASLDGSDGFTLPGVNDEDRFGHSIAPAGDFNDDGIADFVIGAPWQIGPGDPGRARGAVYVFFGEPGIGASGTFDPASLDGTNGFIIWGRDRRMEEATGRGVAPAGDVNGDDLPDILISGEGILDSTESHLVGGGWVVFGGPEVGETGEFFLENLNGADGFMFQGAESIGDKQLGWSVGYGTDLNGDGFADIALGGIHVHVDDFDRAGAARILYGAANVGGDGTVSTSILDGRTGFSILGYEDGLRAGWTVSSVGDFNGDGLDDMMLWAPGADPGGRSVAGQTYLVWGCAGRESAALVDLHVVTGDLLAGGVDDLEVSDDSYVHTRSGFGQTFVDLHNMTMVVNASTTVDNPATLDLTIESRIDEPAGTARVSLRNWNTGDFEPVDTFPVGDTDDAHVIADIDATNYVNTSGGGEIDLQLRHVVFVPFLAFTFESFVDQVEIAVR